MTQVDYGLGILLIVPPDDLIDRHRLVVWQILLSEFALMIAGIASSEPVMLTGMVEIEILTVANQAFVACTASLPPP
ncbi:hypothetical protein [Bosea psychrotolerans]|uniref:hypothetical protein n=1 Tax=Bosea psychrotolerans TaxID=1871628 RepID=UPI001AECB37D|nr:hypothetical protein [Bosea psychrotolerans]